jgi:GNAT superfamily N-acetyltransferase
MDIKDYTIRPGISSKQIAELLNFSNTDPSVIKYTGDPVRFKNLTAYKNWLQKGRHIYTLCGREDSLKGIVWFSHEDPPEDIFSDVRCVFTFGIRLYSDARGKGLGLPFMTKAFSEFMKTDVYKKSVQKGFWLTAVKENYPAIKLYKRFGFAESASGKNKLLMTYMP